MMAIQSQVPGFEVIKLLADNAIGNCMPGFSEIVTASITKTSVSQIKTVLITTTVIVLTLTDTETYTAIIITATTTSKGTEIQTTTEDGTTLTSVVIILRAYSSYHTRLQRKVITLKNRSLEVVVTFLDDYE
jgi:hypothetical protein